MRILHVIHGLPKGGLENGVVNLCAHLPREEFQQTICCLDTLGEMADRVPADIEISHLKRGRHDLRLPFRLARLIRKFKPDIIHCRNWNAWLDTVLAHKISGKQGKLVWSFHGFPDGQEQMPGRRRLLSRWLASKTANLFAVCKDSAERYAKISGIPQYRFDLIYNGVDCSRFSPSTDKESLRRQLGFPEQTFLITTVASLTPVKDHGMLVRAAAIVQQKINQPITYLFIGEGKEREKIEQEITALGLNADILLTGNRDDIPDCLAASDCFVLPSRLEGMSNAIIEAMASGLPIIANHTGGNPELVEDGENGLLGQSGDPEPMAIAICQLVQDSILCQQMSQNSRTRVELHFSLDAMMKHYADYYQQAAS